MKLRKWLNNEWYWYLGACIAEGLEPSRWDFYRGLAWVWIAGWICRWRGHKWLDMSQCGPDSGDLHMVCTRCGKDHYRILY